MFTLQGQGSVALAPASSLPEGSLGFGLLGDSWDVCDQLMMCHWCLEAEDVGDRGGAGLGMGSWGKSRSPE